MVDGQNTPSQRPAAPHTGGPLGSSGAAPEQTPPAPAADPAGGVPAPRVSPEAGSGSSHPGSGTSTTPAEVASDAGAKPSVAAAGTGSEPSAGSVNTGPGAAEAGAPTNTAGKSDLEDKSPAPDKGAESSAADKSTAESAKKRQKSEGPPPPSVTAVALAGRERPPRGMRTSHPGAMARGTAEWARRPTGRLVLPAILAVLLLGAAGTAGAYLVPAALDSAPAPSPTPGIGQDAAAPSGAVPSGAAQPSPGAAVPGTVPPGAGQPGGVLPSVSAAPTVAGVPSTAVTMPGTVTATRPADALAGWAQQVGTKAGVPVVAVQAYGYAELVAARVTPGCRLSWTTLAAIGKVESAHGSVNRSVLNADGTVTPPIFGLPLDGQGGRQMIRDTDQGVLDKDATYDRAIGPMQFIPTTWNELAVGNAVDADGNGVSDPNDIDDAALAAALYLCKGGRDMSRPDKWWEGILSYNAVRPYAQEVFTTANQYGQLSRG